MAVIMSKYISLYVYELFPRLIFTVKRLRHCYLKEAISQKVFSHNVKQPKYILSRFNLIFSAMTNFCFNILFENETIFWDIAAFVRLVIQILQQVQWTKW